MIRRLLLATLIVTALLTPSRGARAEASAREQSRSAFRRGVSQAREGNYAAARDAFLQAYKLFPHPSILLNLGIARVHTGEWIEAEQDLVHFLADDGGARRDELASARTELAHIRTHLGAFRLRVSPDGAHAMLDGHELALIAGNFVDVRTTRGPHDLEVDAEGYLPEKRVISVDAERAPNVDLVLAPASAPQADTHPARHASERTASGGKSTAGWVLLGGGVVAAAVGTYTGVEAISAANAYNTKGNTSYQDAPTKSRGVALRTASDVAFIGAIGLSGFGLYFLLTPPAGSKQTGVVIGPGFGGIAGTF